MSPDNMISALIGSLIGISVSGIFGRFATATKLNRIRNVIIEYSENIGIPKSKIYCRDMESIKEYFLHYLEINFNLKQMENNEVDIMPMFNSDIFKSFTHENLLRVSYNSDTYTTLLDMIYSIDFLKNNMPSDFVKELNSKVDKHLKDKKIKESEKFNHLKNNCQFFKKITKGYIDNSDLKIQRAKDLENEFKDLIYKLKGNNFWWTIKYFYKQ